MKLQETGENARAASRILATLTSADKNRALEWMADALIACKEDILAANRQDVALAKKLAAEGKMKQSMLDRLELSSTRIEGMAGGIRKLVALPDPVGEVCGGHRHPNGMRIYKLRVPLGVVGIIYEARPNVTSDAAALCIKSGNAVILRGGSDALHSNLAIINALRSGLEESGFPVNAVQLISDTSRETATEMMRLRKYIDVLIPRGGAGLIRSVMESATVPVIETGAGNCHIYVDQSAEADMAVAITVNAKISRPSVCNAAETLLIHESAAERLLPVIADALSGADVELRGCERAREIVSGMNAAEESDWKTEYNDYIMAVRVVPSLEAAAAHIAEYSTGHSECIITDSKSSADSFVALVDSAAVYVNASTRFTDGEEFGMGAEIGISTQKLHTRGPMGLKELTTVKYVVEGSGQTR